MKSVTRKAWEELIVLIASELEHNGIRYHIDASSALFVHGIDFEMEDLDVTVEWGSLEKARDVFKRFRPSKIEGAKPPSFEFLLDSMEVHLMSYRSSTGIGEASDRVQVAVQETLVWSKTVDFYYRHMKFDHPLLEIARSYIESGK